MRGRCGRLLLPDGTRTADDTRGRVRAFQAWLDATDPAIAQARQALAQPNPKGRRGRAPRPKPKRAASTRPRARVTLGGVRFDFTWPGQGMTGGLDTYGVTVARKRRKVDTYTIRTRDRANAAGWRTMLLDAAADAARAAVAEGQLTPEEGAAVVEDAARARLAALRREARARQAVTGTPAELPELPELATPPEAPRRRPAPAEEFPF